MSIEIVYETHSTSTDNESGIATGWLDGRLSETGRRQAGELGARRRANRLDAVFTSDLGRAVETAELAFGGSVYSQIATQRIVIFNGQVLREGDAVTEELRLEEIRPRSAVMRLRDQRFEIVF